MALFGSGGNDVYGEESEGEEAQRNEIVVFNPWRYDFFFFLL